MDERWQGRAVLPPFVSACQAEIKANCADVPQGPAVLACLDEHKAELSKKCAAAFKTAKPAGNRAKARRPVNEEEAPASEEE